MNNSRVPFRSIRWYLPFTYAGIALLSILALGVILLVALRTYYTQLELDYLNGNITTVASAVETMLEDEMPLAVVQVQIASYSFLSQTRIELRNASDRFMADSGLPIARNLSISAEPQLSSTPNTINRIDAHSSMNPAIYRLSVEEDDVLDLELFRTSIEVPLGISVDDNAGNLPTLYTPVITFDFRTGTPLSDNQSDSFTSTLPVTSTLYGFGLTEEISQDIERSEQIVLRELFDSEGKFLGTLRLSDGPAYGRQIVNQVATVWVFAGIITVMLAGFLGWRISRRITVPLSKLTNATTLMAEGDLSVRAKIQRTDELGMLSGAFNNMAQQIENTVITLRRFVADAAHELHTPLTALQTNFELAVDETDSTRQKKYLDRGYMQLKRLEAVTDGLLDLSRIEVGSPEEERKPVALTKLIQEISELYASRSEQAEIDFILDLSSDNLVVKADIEQLRRAISNLLDNALKFTPAGKTISVKVQQVDNFVRIKVADQGIGILKAEQPYIFNRFYRGRNVQTYNGSGLGLAIVKSIVDAHHGTISVKSQENIGTEFTVQLPLFAT